ncbi:hypothetical protein DPMN_053999 [Dreissena polymorpha]|uniref:Uncharacterized protein n=1 Tax=Dreissena polymorpha TaxID=45954 RepID=A0A9D4HSQ1_DREPO|nr:hypothetical protein DPMN_053999 [Dreissena polymorpha]
MDGRRTKTDPKTSPEQSDELKTIFQLAKNVTSRVFTRFLYKKKINKTNVFTKFNDDWAKNKTAPPTGRQVFSPIWTIFQLFHDDWAKIVTSRVFTRKTAPPTGGHVFQQTGTTFELNHSTNISLRQTF